MGNAKKNFEAVIVGGGVAGYGQILPVASHYDPTGDLMLKKKQLILTRLTPAHAFDSAGIDYVLLEARNDIAPPLGATIVMMPNGARILGVYEAMKDIMEEIESTTLRKSE